MRRRCYSITGEMLIKVLPFDGKIKRHVILNGPPPDATFCQIYAITESRQIVLEFAHPSFEEIGEGQTPVTHMVQIMYTDDIGPNEYAKSEEL